MQKKIFCISTKNVKKTLIYNFFKKAVIFNQSEESNWKLLKKRRKNVQKSQQFFKKFPLILIYVNGYK